MISKPEECPYIEGNRFVKEYFYDMKVEEKEFSLLLAEGWRKFGYFFFRPACETCFECIPVRVLAEKYIPSKSQRRVLAKNRDTEITITDNTFSDERYAVLKKHSEKRFSQNTGKEDFILNFCISAAPSFVMEYRFDKKLFGTGYLDYAGNALSSVYFAFDPDYSFLSPGILSCITEINLAKKMNLKFYYPGYYVAGNRSMDYKIRFKPYQYYSREKSAWESGL